MANHVIVHVELSSTNLADSQAFYRALFGWKTQPWGSDYALFTPPSGPGGGFNPVGGRWKPGDVVVYVSTDDIPGTLARVKALGGKTVVPETEIPDVGWYALFHDPSGNVLGLFKAKGGSERPSEGSG